MVNEVLHYWVHDPGGVYVDLTLGMGGHSEALLERFPNARQIGVDWDPESLQLARRRLEKWGSRSYLVEGNFATIGTILKREGFPKVNGFLFDLGPSTFQILHSERGLSYQKDTPLDMRMSPRLPVTASSLLKNMSEPEMQGLLAEWGEISPGLARRLAREILRAGPLKSSLELAQAISRVSGNRGIWARVFQAIRIMVNAEMQNLDSLFRSVGEWLLPGGRVVAISFHSLEDRRVKSFFRESEKNGTLRVLTRHVIRASQDEIRDNPKARSCLLRASEKT